MNRSPRKLLTRAEGHILRDVGLWKLNAAAWSEAQDLLRSCRRSLVRASAVDMSGVVAIPTEQAQVSREPELDDYSVPASSGDPIRGVVASGVNATVALAVVDGQELLNSLSATDASVAVVGENGGLVSGGLPALPSKAILPATAVSGQGVGSSLDLAGLTQATPAMVPTLNTDTSLASSFAPSTDPLFALHGADYNVREALQRLETELLAI